MVNRFLVITTVPGDFQKGVPQQSPIARKNQLEYPPSILNVSKKEIAEVARSSTNFRKLVSQYKKAKKPLTGLEFAHSWLRVKKHDGTLMVVKKMEFISNTQIKVTWPFVQASEGDLPPRKYKKSGFSLHTQRNREATAARSDRSEVVRIAPRRVLRRRRARAPAPVAAAPPIADRRHDARGPAPPAAALRPAMSGPDSRR